MIPFLILFISWSVLHSITASLKFKRWVASWTGQRTFDGLYRITYNLFAFLTFLPVLLLGAGILPHKIIWSISWPGKVIFYIVQLFGLAGLFWSLMKTDLLRFLGLGQALRFFQGKEDVNPPPVLVTTGPYTIVRHPLYLFSLLFIWFYPQLTLNLLIFNLVVTIYFWVGSIYEENRLLETFGEAYRTYQLRVPRLIPIKISSRG